MEWVRKSFKPDWSINPFRRDRFVRRHGCEMVIQQTYKHIQQ